MKKIFFAFCLVLISSGISFSQLLFSENFNYPVRDTLTNIGGWNSSFFPDPSHVEIRSPGLSYSGYIGSGNGNCAYMNNQPLSNTSLCQIGNDSTGTIYVSLLIKVDNFTAGATEGYNICLDQAGGTTNLNTKLYTKKVSSTTFNFGIKKINGNAVYSPNVYNTGTVYLAVISYTFKPGSSTNDVAKIYIFSSGVPVSEPVTPLALDSANADLVNIGDLILSNSFVQSGMQATPVRIDGIRIGKSWNSVLFQNANLQLSMKGLIQGFYNNITGKMVQDTVSVSLRYNRPPYTLAETSKSVLDSNGNGTFTFKNIWNNAPYFIEVNHRNMLESWSSITKEFYLNVTNFDFTYYPSSTYGNNVILKGSKYCFYNGEIVHDGVIDVTDYQYVDNNSFNFVTGYRTTDLNGDNVTDISDMSIVELNSYNFVQVISP
ncbi:MAG: hypothetical protein JSS91_01930 [Bacteroidetes bacterium]|nr:hypothetical protein [Bacteroidota bacterium]